MSLFVEDGAIPRNIQLDVYFTGGGDYLVNKEGDYVYLAGYPEGDEESMRPTGIASVNLKTGEGKVLYETPYMYIQQLKSDGEYYYLIEIAKGYTYLTAIDRDGNLVRRYEMPLDEAFIAFSGRKRVWGSGERRLLLI